jgi:hypothetical protein
MIPMKAFQRRDIGQPLVNEGVGAWSVIQPFIIGLASGTSALRMEGVPPEVLMCLPLSDKVPEGSVAHHPAFSV